MTPRTRRRLLPAVVVVALLPRAGSGDGTAEAADPLAGPTTAAEPVELTVLAASSLTEVFEALGEQYEAANEGTK